MPRRTKQASVETRERILDAAQASYLEHGVSAASLTLIAEKAGCTRGAIYWHFPSALDLLHAVLERGRYPLLEHLEALSHGSTQPLAMLREVFMRYLQAIQEDARVRASLEILLFRCDAVGYQQEAWALRRADSSQFIELTRRVLEMAHDAGELASDVDPDDAAVWLSSILVGMVTFELVLDKETLRTHGQAALQESISLISAQRPTGL